MTPMQEPRRENNVPDINIVVMNVGEDVFSPNDKESLESSEFSDEALKSIYSDVEEMPRPKRILKQHIKKPKWWEPDEKVRFVKVLRTYNLEYMPEEYIEIIEMWKNRKIAEREETVLTRGKTPVLTRGKTVRKKPTCNDKVIHDVF